MVWGTPIGDTVPFQDENTGLQFENIWAEPGRPYRNGHHCQKPLIQSCRCTKPNPKNLHSELRDRRHSDSDAYKSKKPSRKQVRFADDMGLSLVDVRHFVTSDKEGFRWACSATIPYNDDIWLDEEPSSSLHLEPAFQQPGVQSDFLRRVQQQKVCLENCLMSEKNRTITGVVRVANTGFTKQVQVRFSTNNWVTYEDIDAKYINVSDGITDRFMFVITVPWFMAKGGRVDFALQYNCQDHIFWDNNAEKNYTVFC